MIQSISTSLDYVYTQLSDFYSSNAPKISEVARKVLSTGIYTTTCWGLWWLNPRLSPIGYMTGFLFQREIQNKINEFKESKLTKSKLNVALLSASMLLSGVITFPILIPTAIFGTSAVMGKIARDILFPAEGN